jgi:5-methylcytosine-specific restriction endonuclease McrA
MPAPKDKIKREEWKRNIGNARIKMGLAKGNKNPMFGRCGCLSYRWNIKHSQKTKNKISRSKTGVHYSNEFVKKRREYMLGRYIGKKNPMYIDGRNQAKYPIQFKRIRKEIFNRDNHTCQICLTQKDYLDLAGVFLEAHHIDGDKNNNLKENLISLCSICHRPLQAKGRREHWMVFFHSMLTKDYGYQYTEDQKIILDFGEKTNG